jgi:hypothetical protein
MNKNALAGVLGVLLALSIGGNAWLYTKNTSSKQSVKDIASVSLLNDSLQRQILLLDSMQALLTSTQADRAQLAERVDELESSKGGKVVSSGGNNDALIADLQSKIAYYKQLASQSGTIVQNAAATGKVTKEDAGKLAALQVELDSKLKEIEKLNAQLAAATSEKDGAIGERDAAIARKANLEEENADLKDRIGRAAYPQYGTLLSFGQVKKGEETIETFKAKGLEKFKITFDVLDNPLIREPIEEEVTIRIVGPEGEVFSTSNSALVDKSKVYSIRQTIISDGEMHKVKWYYPQSGTIQQKLKKGKYTTELWSRGLLRQKNTFELN